MRGAPEGDPITYRRLEAIDLEAYRRFRLDALQTAPLAFGGSFDEEKAKDDAQVANSIKRSWMVAGWTAESELVGTAGMFVRPEAKLQHKAVMFGLFVHPLWRAKGIGGALVDRTIAEARKQVEALQLAVAVSSAGALSLYRRRDFRQYGLERRALKVGGEYVDEYLMELVFDGD